MQLTTTETSERDLSFDTHCASLYRELVNHAKQFTQCRSRAEDVVQDSMMKAFRFWPTFVEREHDRLYEVTRGWLFRIVTNTYMKHYRTQKRRREVHVDDERSTRSVYDNDPRAEHDAEAGDEVREALARLMPYHREVVELHYLDGLDLSVVAERLGIPKKTVHTRLHRARNAMRKHLGEYATRAYRIRPQDEPLVPPPPPPPPDPRRAAMRRALSAIAARVCRVGA